MPREALVVGLGLIGGSIALRLRERGWRVRYDDPHVDTEEFERGDDAPLVVIATPVDVAIEQVKQPRSGVVTSVCSVMQPLRDAASGRFVAGHPLAGSEQSGFAAARADLFDGKRWFVDADDPQVEELVRDCGAIADRVDAAEHDEAVALTSHLPQVLSTALAAMLAEREELLRFAGSGLKTFLRLAGSDGAVWTPVIDANRVQIAGHAEELERVVRRILGGESGEVFDEAQRLWRKL